MVSSPLIILLKIFFVQFGRENTSRGGRDRGRGRSRLTAEQGSGGWPISQDPEIVT